jgi:homoserine dehydrogenase
MAAEVGVGLVGLGTVGSAVARRLVDHWEMLAARAGAVPVLRRVAVRDPSRRRDLPLPRVTLDGDAEGLVDDPGVGVVVEVMGGVDRASALMDRALRRGKPVVTANKAALAAHGLELSALAVAQGVSLRYEAAAGGGLPVVGLLRDSLRGDRVSGLQMIINGTTNIILSAMERDGVALADALGEAQRRGFAEADPSADIDGHDAAAKVLLLSRLAFDAPLSIGDVETTGIGDLDAVDIACAQGLGGSVKLVGNAVDGGDGLALWVRPTVVMVGHPLHGVDDGDNALVVDADLAGRIVVRGPGGGGASTASAVVSDIVASVRAPQLVPPVPTAAATVVPSTAIERAAYIRVRLAAVPEAAALVVQALEDRGVGVAVSAPAPGLPAAQQLALLTEVVTGEMLDRAVDTLDSLAAVDAVAAVLDCVAPA